MLLVAASAHAWSAERAIDREVVVPANVDAVWQAWTTSEGIKTFFAPDAHVELRVDGPFEIFINPYVKPGLKGADGMRIIGFQDKRMLSFTWNAPPSLPEARANRTVVILRFEPAGEVLANLQKRFAGGPVDWTEWLQKMKALSQ